MNKISPPFANTENCLLTACMLCLILISQNSALAQKADLTAAQQEGQTTEVPVRSPSKILKTSQATIRTQRQMEQAALYQPQEMGEEEIEGPRPTIDPWDYAAAKAAANRSRVSAPYEALLEMNSPEILAPPVPKTINVAGTGMAAGGGFPPDTHGAIGNTHFVEVTNSRIEMFNLAGTKVISMSLATFFGYTTRPIFDPRVIYDKDWDRWIVIADTRAESTTVQRLLLAVSATANPTGSYFVYKVDINFLNDTDEFFDFPQLGMDQNSILVTANIFEATFKEARLYLFAKSRLYNGLPVTSPIFRGLAGTLAPPIVLDQNAKTFLISSPTGGSALKLYALRDSSSLPNTASCVGCTGSTLSGPVNIPVTAYTVPPSALQPAPCTAASQDLDTSDARFVNASTQNQNFLYQIHTISVGGRAKPRWYQINTTTNTVFRTSTITTGSGTYDFNASIAANATNDVFVTWSTSAPTLRPQVYLSGRRSTDSNTIPLGSLVFTSPTCLSGNTNAAGTAQRWGDYSAVTVDPLNSLQAWLVNENANSTSLWGSRVVRIGF